MVITDSHESIKVWDVRSKSIVYELATGNNEVSSMAWDGQRSTLFAAVECRGLGRDGCYYSYRRAKVPSGYHHPNERASVQHDRERSSIHDNQTI